MKIRAQCTRFLAFALLLCTMQCHLSAMNNTESAESLIRSAQRNRTQFDSSWLSEKFLLVAGTGSSIIAGLSVYTTLRYVFADPNVAKAMFPPLVVATCSGTVFTGLTLHTMLKERADHRHNNNQSNV